MSKPINDGGPAFPKSAFYAPGTIEDGLYNGPDDGMSLRDYFAGQALQGIIASHAGPDCSLPTAAMAALSAYDFADAMLEAREPK